MIIVEINGEEIEVDEADIPALLAQLNAGQSKPVDHEKMMMALGMTMKQGLGQIANSLESGLAAIKIPEVPEVKIPKIEMPKIELPKPVKPVTRIVMTNIERDRRNMISSCELEIIR